MRLKWLILCAAGLVALGGCGTLPNDGPSARAIEKNTPVEGQARYSIVNLDYRVSQTVAAVPHAVPLGLTQAGSDAPNDLISDGDLLSVTIFESGTSPLFGRTTGIATAGIPGAAGGQSQDTFPRLVVDRNGVILLPFAGSVHVRGLTTEAAGSAIRAALRGRAVDPQVLVNVMTSAQNSVSVLGEVRSPGRFPVSANNDRLLDVIAASGGPTKPLSDVRVVLVRGDQTFTTPLNLLMEDPAQNVRLAPHDQVRLMLHERKFNVFGALGRVTEAPITDEHVTLTSAISRSGGLDTYSADDAGVFVFRFERPEVAQALAISTPATPKGVPMVYHLDMRDPNSYFVASDFEIQPDDILYVSRASSVPVRKFLDLVSVVTNLTYTVSVTSANIPVK